VALRPNPMPKKLEEKRLTEKAPYKSAGRAFVREHRPTSLIGRLANAEEVASIAAYLCTPAAGATTGAALRVSAALWGHRMSMKRKLQSCNNVG
jgi:NAD(P)-dependent dehydrogenase (short-subunit alcohol dehydrogenase family)